MKRFALAATLVASLLGTDAAATTVHPTEFNRILTEGRRTATVDGADISGNAAVAGNGNVNLFNAGDLNTGDNVLLAGRVVGSGQDAWEFTNASGFLDLEVLNFASSSRKGTSIFGGSFDLFVDGVRRQFTGFGGSAGDNFSGQFSQLRLDNSTVRIVARAQGGASDYDLSLSLIAVPLPASGLLLIAGLAGAGTIARRRRNAR